MNNYIKWQCEFMSNELFAQFLDETMTYSTGLFKKEDEDLKVAQLRKISSLIEKAIIDEKHEVLEIGSGWGSFAIEVVNQTGCKYTGITLSKEQLKLAEKKVKDAGLQFSSMPDERYNEHMRSSDFIKEYIFPGACIPSFSRVTSAMANASRLSKILALGFDEKFIRTWEYYFDYCAAGFKSRTLGVYQVVFSRPGNVAVLNNPYQSLHQDLDSVPEGDINSSY
nr:tuberculostearic acid methyltransferase ufaa1 [Quercus suber]